MDKTIFFLNFKHWLLILICLFSGIAVFAQDGMLQPNYMQYQNNSSYIARSTAFKQEIARLEINIVRPGKSPLSITQVPRLERDDILKIKMLDDQINGIKPDQSGYDWTFLVAFINPSRNNDRLTSVSEEIRFKKTGWYREYSFRVPYDSQPIFFLYPKPNYRDRILKMIDKNQDELKKIGEKTIELATTYEKIGTFLSELQKVVYRNQYYQMYGNNGIYNGYSINGSLNGTGNYPGFNSTFTLDQMVERLAQNFNIQLPNCWQNGNSPYGGIGTYNPYGMQQDFTTRASCVAKSVRLEDLDMSISRMIQEGGIFAAAQLAQKYPQIAQWINIAAIAVDLILKIAKKAPLKLVPTLVGNNGSQGQSVGYYQRNLTAQQDMSGSTETAPNTTATYVSPSYSSSPSSSERVKVSVYSETLPSDNNQVTAYPFIINKWEADSDPNLISLPIPALAESCLRPGQNILRSVDLMKDWMSDPYTQDFRLKISSPSGFYREIPLQKNIGLGGWEFNLAMQDFESFPKINIPLESYIVGKRGFNEIRSPNFELPLPSPAKWEIAPESQNEFIIGGKRTIILKNLNGNCKCLQTAVFKPSFGGQFIFEAGRRENGIQISDDGSLATFNIDVSTFSSGAGKLELRQYNGETTTLNLELYPTPPQIDSLKVYRGDRRAIITGTRLEQIRAVKINGNVGIIEGGSLNNELNRQTSEKVQSLSETSTEPIQSPVNVSITERTLIFDEPSLWRGSNTVSMELELFGNRTIEISKTFEFLSSRPAIATNDAKEVEALATGNFVVHRNALAQSVLEKSPVFLIEPSQITVIGQNTLTDYDFKLENLSVETRIENSQFVASELPSTNFEVLDWKSLKVTFQIDEKLLRILGGKRLQFRIRDRVRGDSDWFTIRQTFVRLPYITAVDCAADKKGNCELKGENLEYINQISIDGGKSWTVRDSTLLNLRSTPDGKQSILIPALQNKKLLQIKLRDYPSGEGITVTDFSFTNFSKGKS